MPGSGKQSAEVQAQIVEFLEAGIDPTTIHRRLKVGRSSIYRMKRCLQQHGQAYAPSELNKKNGRPKVMTAEQEREICNWLKDPQNRERYLDDMVWFIHDRFGMVCSTTTCSKIKRKWLKVIEAEERGETLDPEVAQEQVRQEAFRMGKKPAAQRGERRDVQAPTAPVASMQQQLSQEPIPSPVGQTQSEQQLDPRFQQQQEQHHPSYPQHQPLEDHLHHQYPEPPIDPQFHHEAHHPSMPYAHYHPQLQGGLNHGSSSHG